MQHRRKIMLQFRDEIASTRRETSNDLMWLYKCWQEKEAETLNQPVSLANKINNLERYILHLGQIYFAIETSKGCYTRWQEKEAGTLNQLLSHAPRQGLKKDLKISLGRHSFAVSKWKMNVEIYGCQMAYPKWGWAEYGRSFLAGRVLPWYMAKL